MVPTIILKSIPHKRQRKLGKELLLHVVIPQAICLLLINGPMFVPQCQRLLSLSTRTCNSGSDVITSTLTGTPSSITNTLNAIFGCTGYPCFQGKIDEVRLYSKQLSATETLAIYNFRCDTYTTVLPSCCTAPMPNGQCSTTCTTICCPTVPSATNV